LILRSRFQSIWQPKALLTAAVFARCLHEEDITPAGQISTNCKRSGPRSLKIAAESGAPGAILVWRIALWAEDRGGLPILS
jgi:hypothetical protein